MNFVNLTVYLFTCLPRCYNIVAVLHIKLCTVSVIFVCYIAADLDAVVK